MAFSHSHVLTYHSSQGRSPAISLPRVTFSSWVVLPRASPISSYPNPSKYYQKHYFEETSRSPWRLPSPSEFMWYLHSILSCTHGTVSESQALTQVKQIFSKRCQIREQILLHLCSPFLGTWSEALVGTLLPSAALAVHDRYRCTVGRRCSVLVRSS